MYPFNYYSPATITEASSALKKDPGSMVVAGSTDLLSEMKEGVVRPSSLISLTEISSLRDVTWNENGLSIGAMVTLTEIASDPMIRRRCSAAALLVLPKSSIQLSQERWGSMFCFRRNR